VASFCHLRSHLWFTQGISVRWQGGPYGQPQSAQQRFKSCGKSAYVWAARVESAAAGGLRGARDLSPDRSVRSPQARSAGAEPAGGISACVV